MKISRFLKSVFLCSLLFIALTACTEYHVNAHLLLPDNTFSSENYDVKLSDPSETMFATFPGSDMSYPVYKYDYPNSPYDRYFSVSPQESYFFKQSEIHEQ